MPKRKRTIKEIRQMDFVKMSELAELTGLRYSTIKFYADIGLLPYEQKGERLAKYYPVKEATQRLQRIAELKKKRKTIEEIKKYFKSK